MKEYLQSKTVMSRQGVTSSGLTSAQAASRLEKNGKNKLAEGKKDSLIKRFLLQLADPMIIILIAAAFISAFTAAFGGESEGYMEYNYHYVRCGYKRRFRGVSGEQGGKSH